MKDYIPLPLPFIPGWDVSGIVEAVGSGVAKFKKGDEVYARPDGTRNGKGTYAEYVVVKETEAALKPKSIDHVHAAAIPVVALTAWQALFDQAGLSKGQKILIHGAAGGVGSVAVQLAKWKGAHVIGAASGHNQAFLRELGADRLPVVGDCKARRCWQTQTNSRNRATTLRRPARPRTQRDGTRTGQDSPESRLRVNLMRVGRSGESRTTVHASVRN